MFQSLSFAMRDVAVTGHLRRFLFQSAWSLRSTGLATTTSIDADAAAPCMPGIVSSFATQSRSKPKPKAKVKFQQQWDPRPAPNRAAPARPASPLKPAAAAPISNQAIKAETLRVVFPDGSNRILGRAEAQLEAQALRLDMVQMPGSADPPVVRLLSLAKIR